MSRRRRGKSSRGTGRRPFVGSLRSRVGWVGSGTSMKAGDSGGMYSFTEEVVKARVDDSAVFFTCNRNRQARHIELERDSIVNTGLSFEAAQPHGWPRAQKSMMWTKRSCEFAVAMFENDEARTPKRRLNPKYCTFPDLDTALACLVQKIWRSATFISSGNQHQLENIRAHMR